MNEDVAGGGLSWAYSNKVKDHFFHPRNFMADDPERGYFDAVGRVGSLACGDIMTIWIKVRDDRIIDLKWRTFGCASAIAATSVFSEMVLQNGGMEVDQATAITPAEIMDQLGGLPARKAHCSVLADKAFHQAINNYFRASSQYDRIIDDGSRIIDPDLHITEQDIASVVLSGAKSLEDVQNQLKVGIGRPEIKKEIGRLIEVCLKQGKFNCPRE